MACTAIYCEGHDKPHERYEMVRSEARQRKLGVVMHAFHFNWETKVGELQI